MVASADPSVSDERAGRDGGGRLPDLRVLLRHVHRELDELPDRGDRPGPAGQRHHAGHARRPARRCSSGPGALVVEIAQAVLRRRRRVGAAPVDRQPGRVRERDGARRRHGRVDQHDPAPAGRGARGRVGFGLKEIDELSRRVPCLCKVAPSSERYHVEDVHRAGGIPTILGELDRAGLLNRGVHTVHSSSLREFLDAWDLRSPSVHRRGGRAVPRGARRRAHHPAVLPVGALGHPGRATGPRAASGTSRTPTPPTAGWPCCTGTWRRTARSSRPPACPRSCGVLRPGRGLREPGGRGRRDPRRRGRGRRRGGHPVRGAARRPGHAGDAVPDLLPQGQGPRPGLRADHRRAVLRRHLGAVHLPRRAGGGGGRGDRAGRGRRHAW